MELIYINFGGPHNINKTDICSLSTQLTGKGLNMLSFIYMLRVNFQGTQLTTWLPISYYLNEQGSLEADMYSGLNQTPTSSDQASPSLDLNFLVHLKRGYQLWS